MSSTAVAPAATSPGTTAQASSMLAKCSHETVRCLGSGSVVKDDLADEGEGALRADQEPAEDLQRRVGVEQGHQSVPGRVLDLELAPHPLGQVGIGQELGPQLQEALGERRLSGGEPAVRAAGRSVDHGARGEDERQRTHGLVAVVAHPAPHAARVVRDDPTHGRDVAAGRVRAQLAAVPGQHPVDVAEHRARAHPHPLAVTFDRDPGPVPPDVDHDPVGLGLAVEAGAPAAEGDRNAGPPTVPQDLRDVPHVSGQHDRLREQPVRACVGGVADEIEHPRQHTIRAEQGRQLRLERLGRAAGQRVGRAVGERLAVGAPDTGHIGLQNWHQVTDLPPGGGGMGHARPHGDVTALRSSRPSRSRQQPPPDTGVHGRSPAPARKAAILWAAGASSDAGPDAARRRCRAGDRPSSQARQ